MPIHKGETYAHHSGLQKWHFASPPEFVWNWPTSAATSMSRSSASHEPIGEGRLDRDGNRSRTRSSCSRLTGNGVAHDASQVPRFWFPAAWQCRPGMNPQADRDAVSSAPNCDRLLPREYGMSSSRRLGSSDGPSLRQRRYHALHASCKGSSLPTCIIVHDMFICDYDHATNPHPGPFGLMHARCA